MQLGLANGSTATLVTNGSGRSTAFDKASTSPGAGSLSRQATFNVDGHQVTLEFAPNSIRNPFQLPVFHAHNRKDSRMTNTPAMNRYSWYGKLPSAGDFLQRRFPDTLQRQWSHWFQVGLLARQQEEQRSGERQFTKAPVWNFVVPPMLGSQMIQMGCLLPGRDSVGRQYPVCIQLSFAPSEWSTSLLSRAESWYQQIGRLGLHAVRNSFPPRSWMRC